MSYLPEFEKDGYMHVHLTKNGLTEAKPVHEIVAAAFLGPQPKGTKIRHIDGNKKNNAAKNLKYEPCLF